MAIYAHIQKLKNQIKENIRNEKQQREVDKIYKRKAKEKYREALRVEEVKYAEKRAQAEVRQKYGITETRVTKGKGKNKKTYTTTNIKKPTSGGGGNVAKQYFAYLKSKRAQEEKTRGPAKTLFNQ